MLLSLDSKTRASFFHSTKYIQLKKIPDKDSCGSQPGYPSPKREDSYGCYLG